MEEGEKMEKIRMSDIEYRRDPNGVYRLYAEKIYSQLLELCKEFGAFGRFVEITGKGEISGLYFVAGPSEEVVNQSNPIDVIKKMRSTVEPNSFYLPVFAQKLEYTRPDDEVARLWDYLDTVEFLTVRCRERNIKLPERIGRDLLFWLIHTEKEQLNPRYTPEIKMGERRIQNFVYQDLKIITESPNSFKGRWVRFGNDPRSLVTKIAPRSDIIHFFHFLRWNNRQRVSLKILKCMGNLSGMDINKKYFKAFKKELKKYPYILYHQDRLPYIHSWGELKGVPEEQNPWAGQIRKVVEYPFMFLSVHMPIVESISRKVMREAAGTYHDIAAEELKKRGNVMPVLIPEGMETTFDHTCCLNNIPYAIDYEREYNDFSGETIPVIVLEEHLLFAMNYILETNYSHTLDPVTTSRSWKIDGQELSIDYTQNETVAEKHAQQVFERILAQKKLNEMRNTTSQEMVEQARRELESKIRSLEVPMVDGEDIPL